MSHYTSFSLVSAVRRQSALLLVALAAAACSPSGGKNTTGDESTTGPAVGESESETVGQKPTDPTTGTDTDIDPTIPDECSSGCGIEWVCNLESDVLQDLDPCAAGTHCEGYEDECGCSIRSCEPNCTADSCPEGQVCDAGSGQCIVGEDPDECSSGCGDIIECTPEGSGDSTGGELPCEPGFHCAVDVHCECTVALCQPDCDPTDPATCPEGKVCDVRTKSCEG